MIFYVKIMDWWMPDFAVHRYIECLIAIHETIERDGELALKGHRFYIEARKSGRASL